MSYELGGVVKLVQEVESFKDGAFTKRGIVVTVENGKFPQEILLEFVQDKVTLLDDVSSGDEVQVTFDIRGREFNGRYFNNLQGWKLQKTASIVGNEANVETPFDEILAEESGDDAEKYNKSF